MQPIDGSGGSREALVVGRNFLDNLTEVTIRAVNADIASGYASLP
jgi:hypothetical protein